MRTRMSGGVRGRGLAAPSYSICVDYGTHDIWCSAMFILLAFGITLKKRCSVGPPSDFHYICNRNSCG